MQKKTKLSASHFKNYLQDNIGRKIYLNADDRHPNILQQVCEDYIVLSAIPKENEPGQSTIVPLASIVSLQNVDGLGGLVVYLVR